MTTKDKERHAAQLCTRAGLMADAALDLGDLILFFKYQYMCYRILQYRINLAKR